MNTNLPIRKVHRYLGLFIGIQFLAWTISGLYFSWNDIDSVHGDDMRKSPQYLSADLDIVSPTGVIEKLQQSQQVDSIHSIHLIRLLNKPVYQVAYFFDSHGGGMHPHTQHALADAITGELRSPLTKDEAILVANENVVDGAKVESIELLQETDSHHEYRERPLPAYAINFQNSDCTVYISTQLGTFQSIRHNQWRAFDFLWMFHTMDYAGRDNFNNWLLKTFSLFGLFTVISGFVLFIISSRTIKQITA
ncbi:MAG: PepSY domain-containing protein [Cyclobacteriaceae bacterium]